MKRVWVTKNGLRLKISEMGERHIRNCIEMLHRYHSKKLDVMQQECNLMTAEVAQFEFEQALERIYEEGWDDEAQEFIESFESELRRRLEV